MDVASSLLRDATAFVVHTSTRGTHPDLYAGVDLEGLSALERAWVGWYEWWGNPVLATGVLAFLMHELLYFGRALPWLFIDNFGLFQRYKLQPNKDTPLAAEQWRCTKAVLWTHFTIELPQIYLFFPLATSVGMRTYEVPFPRCTTVAWQVSLFFLLEDTWHYWVHRACHTGWLYRNVHKVHHTYSAPFGLAAEYAHPFEVLFLGAGTVLAPLLFCYAPGGNMHIITMFTWIALRLFQAIDSHSGYELPWGLRKWFPMWAGADHHDYHHEKFIECYASSFRHWDWALGTDKKYHATRERQKRERESVEGKKGK